MARPKTRAAAAKRPAKRAAVVARIDWKAKLEESFRDAGERMPKGLPEMLIEVDKGRGLYRLGVGVVVRP